jgi:hypothetical protein
LIDLSFAGNPYTWCNNRQGSATIKERLDKGLASLNWILLHCDYSLLHIPVFNFDHNPISLNTNNHSFYLPRPFRFEEFQTKDTSCGKVIATAWKSPVLGNPSIYLPKKLTLTKIAMLKWNSSHFGNIQRNIKATLLQLDYIQNSPPCLGAFCKENQLKLDLEKLLLHEETLWHSKSRKSWLTCKDLNTKYFHLSTLIRRRSNDVNFLKLDSGIWVSFRVDVGSNFSNHFTNLFSSSNPTIEVEMLDLFTQVITEEDNLAICTILFEMEVVQTLASLGFQKAPGPNNYTALLKKKYWILLKMMCLTLFGISSEITTCQES